MNYQVLARKWRPKSFLEVIGQDHVLRVLQNAIAQNRLHHAYLFTGTRGVGKTTLGRILAKCFNCEAGVSAAPCCRCETCLSIDACKFVDLIEIDAASRTKVEDIRDLLNNVQYAPAAGRYKVYLIDEVHMLSLHSFNALLKTLEEPPQHVKFLLATTDPQRLPITILSRCLQFNLKNVVPEKIKMHLKNILDAEGIGSEESALRQLANAAQGSIRDALSLLDQAIAFGAGKVHAADVAAMLGTVEQGKLLALIEALIALDAAKIFAIIAELGELAADFAGVLDELLTLLHRIALLQIIPDLDEPVWDNLNMLKKFAQQISGEDVQIFYQIGLIGKRDLELAPNLRSGFEMVMLRMLHFRPESFTANVDNEPAVSMGQNPASSSIAAPASSSAAPPVIAAKAASQNSSLPNSPQEWLSVLMALKLTGTTQALIRHCSIGAFDPQKLELELLLEPAQAPLLNIKHEERISQALQDFLHNPIRAFIKIGSSAMEDTLASITKRNAAIEMEKKVQDPRLKALVDAFGAKILTEENT